MPLGFMPPSYPLAEAANRVVAKTKEPPSRAALSSAFAA
jgi:hypothetical protein